MAIDREISPTSKTNIADLIHIIHGRPVVFDFDLAKLYRIEAETLNKLATRNRERFPDDFRFRLTKDEYRELFPSETGGKTPFVYTEQGITMMTLLLKEDSAVEAGINIVRAFVEMRNFVAKNAPLFERISSIELKQLEFEKETNAQISKLLKQLEEKECAGSEQKIFFSGQIYDAYSFLISLIKRAKKEILLIDGYVNINTLDILRNKRAGVLVSVLTLPSTKLSLNEIRKFNSEYPELKIYKTSDFHDRLLILDREEFYHIGASLKDAGEKSFAITKLEEKKETNLLLERVRKITK